MYGLHAGSHAMYVSLSSFLTNINASDEIPFCESLCLNYINILWKSIMYHICVIHVSIEQSFNKIASQITLAGFEKRTISYFNMLVICWS